MKRSVQQLSRKLLRIKSSNPSPSTQSTSDRPTPPVQQEVGSISLLAAQDGQASLPSSSGGPKCVGYSVASYQAFDPSNDKFCLQIDTNGSNNHIFAAVITGSFVTQNAAQYLFRALYPELTLQLKASGGNVARALQQAVSTLDTRFRSLHSFNRPLLEGAALAACYVDLATSTITSVSSGGNFVAVGRRSAEAAAADEEPGSSSAVAGSFVGTQPPRPPLKPTGNADAPAPLHVQVEQLLPGTDCLVLASKGVWQEVPADQAALRVHHHQALAPQASSGNAAAHLTFYALDCVAQRTRRQEDPRMRSLQELQALHSLWVGSRANYKWAGRQPVRRRRGDVHGDMTAVVLRFDWIGRVASFSKLAGKRSKLPRVGPSSASVSRLPASTHWQLLRMHFLDHARESRSRTRAKWHTLVASALAEKARLAAAAADDAARDAAAQAEAARRRQHDLEVAAQEVELKQEGWCQQKACGGDRCVEELPRPHRPGAGDAASLGAEGAPAEEGASLAGQDGSFLKHNAAPRRDADGDVEVLERKAAMAVDGLSLRAELTADKPPPQQQPQRLYAISARPGVSASSVAVAG